MLAGCGFQPRAADTAIDAPGDTSHSDGLADAPADVAIDMAPNGPADSDGDGVPDATDNCPTVINSDQRDHDGDGRGDVCDLCPHIAEVQDVDSDSDGIGDACDPRPTMAGDTKVLWVGFYDATDTTGWLSNSTWTVSTGKLTGGATNNGLQYIYPNASYQHAFVQTSVHLNALGTPTSSVSVAAQVYNGDAGFTQYYACEAALQQGNAKNAIAIAVYPGQSQVDPQPFGGTVAAGSDLLYTDAINAGQHSCTVAQGATKLTVTQAAGASTGVVSLAAAYANVSYDYLWVVEIGQ